MTTRTYAIAVTWQMPSPVRVTTRNLSFGRADDVTLAFTVYSDDDAETVLDVSGAIATLSLWEEGGPVVLTATGEVTDGAAGRIDIALTSSQTDGLVGRYRYSVTFSDTSAAVLVEGVMQVTSFDVLATPSDAIRNGDHVIDGELRVSYINPHDDIDRLEVSRTGWGRALSAELTIDGYPANTNPDVGTIGNQLVVDNIFKARFYKTPGLTYTMDTEGVDGPANVPAVVSFNTNLAGSVTTGTNAPYQMSIASDTVDNRDGNTSLALQVLAHNFGGTGTYGARSVQRLVLTTKGDFNDTATGQQHTVQEVWFTAAHNTGGTGTGTSAKGFAYTLNPQTILDDGATHWVMASGMGEVNVGVRATRRTVTLGGTVTAGDVLTVTFSGADVTNSPVAVTYTTGAAQSLTMVANGMEAAINYSDDLKASGVSAIARSGVVTIHYPYGKTVSVAVSTSGGATTTLTLGAATGGASADVKLGASIIRVNADASGGAVAENTAALFIGAQWNAPQSGAWSHIFAVGALGSYAGGQWPLRYDGTILGARFQRSISNTARSARMAPNLAGYGVDLRRVYFSNALLSGPGGLDIVGPKIYMGGASIEATEDGLVIDVAGKVATAVAVASGGGGGSGVATSNYFKGDLVRDSAGGMHLVAAVNPATGAVTSLTTLHMPSCRGAAPSNPLTTEGGSGLGLTINATWPSSGDTLSLNPSGGDIVLGGGVALLLSRTDAIEAAGSDQAGATALTTVFNNVTVAAAGEGVQLGAFDMTVINSTAVDLNVYPEDGAEIDDFGTNAAAVLAPGDSALFIRMSSTKVISR